MRLSTPGVAGRATDPLEVVATVLPTDGVGRRRARWRVGRFRALVVGPGLGAEASADDVRDVVSRSPVPVVVDGDGLNALGSCRAGVGGNAVLTPHDGEYERLTGAPPGADRFDAARRLAATAGAVVLLKGSTTIVAAPDGRALVAVAPDARLATAGTGDVLAASSPRWWPGASSRSWPPPPVRSSTSGRRP